MEITETEAKKIGSRQGLISVGIGLLIAQLISVLIFSSEESFIKAFFWFVEIGLLVNVVLGVVIMLLCGHFLGRLAGKAILIQKRNFILTGILTGISVLLLTSFLASWIGFFREGLDRIESYDNPFLDFILKPMYWITIFGTIPAAIVGAWFGWQVKRKGEEKPL